MYVTTALHKIEVIKMGLESKSQPLQSGQPRHVNFYSGRHCSVYFVVQTLQFIIITEKNLLKSGSFGRIMSWLLPTVRRPVVTNNTMATQGTIPTQKTRPTLDTQPMSQYYEGEHHAEDKSSRSLPPTPGGRTLASSHGGDLPQTQGELKTPIRQNSGMGDMPGSFRETGANPDTGESSCDERQLHRGYDQGENITICLAQTICDKILTRNHIRIHFKSTNIP